MAETVIVAEDSPPNRKILAHLLTKFGFHVIACEHGAEAWEQLQANPSAVAVISDIMMPNMDGLALLKVIRENDAFVNIPVLLVTAISDKEYIEQARALRVSGYILKPVTYERVLKKLKEIFPQRKFPDLAA